VTRGEVSFWPSQISDIEFPGCVLILVVPPPTTDVGSGGSHKIGLRVRYYIAPLFQLGNKTSNESILDMCMLIKTEQSIPRL